MMKMFGYKVDLEKTTSYSEREDVEWGAWSANSFWSFNGVSKTEEYPDVVSKFDIGIGEECLVVWVQWSSGDSFGHERGAYAEALGIFKDEKSAEELAQAAEHLNNFEYGKFKKNGDGYSLNTSDGQHFEDGFCSWRGYFDSLDFVTIERCTITK